MKAIGVGSAKTSVHKGDIGLLGVYVDEYKKYITELQAMIKMFDEQSPMKVSGCIYKTANELWKIEREIEFRYLHMKKTMEKETKEEQINEYK